MAFKYKYHEDGVAPQFMGEQVSIYDKYAVSCGQATGSMKIYERGDDGDWTNSVSYNFSPDVGISAEVFKGVVLAASSIVSTAAMFFSEDNFAIGGAQGLSPSDSPSGFGKSASMSDSYIAIGAPETGPNNEGAVYIYEKSGDEWATMTETQIITADDAGHNDFFGTSVAIDEDFLIIGASGSDSNRGAVYIFVRDEETGDWEQFQKVVASDGVAGDGFGGKVSLSNDYFAVGAEYVDLSETEINVGAVYIFNYSTIWNELKKITGVGESGLIANNFGHSVDLNGDYLIVGSPNAQNGGVVDTFYKKRNWGHLIKLDSALTSTGDKFGESVGVYYPYCIIGASDYSTNLGRVYFYEDPPVRLRLAQEFEADFQPSKASVYLKRSGINGSTSWSLQNDRATIIDASNFSTITDANSSSEIVDLTGNTISQWKMNDDAATQVVINEFGTNGTYNIVDTSARAATGKINGALNFELQQVK
jgi:hypothetical protein